MIATSKNLEDEISNIISSKTVTVSEEVKAKVIKRLKSGNLTRDENSANHFCAFFVAVDRNVKEIFIGHHKKSGLWLPNGGHLDRNETLLKAVKREILEEWGENSIKLESIESPKLITIQEIENDRQTCKIHFDIWFFINVSKPNFQPDQSLLKQEYITNKWINFINAKKLNTSKEVLIALNYLIEN